MLLVFSSFNLSVNVLFHFIYKLDKALWIYFLLVRWFGHFATLRLQRDDAVKTRAEISNQKTCSTIRQPRFDFLLRNRSKRPSLFGRVSLELSDSRRRPFHPEHKGQNDRGRQNVEGQSSSHLVRNADSEQRSRALVPLWLFNARYIVKRPPFSHLWSRLLIVTYSRILLNSFQRERFLSRPFLDPDIFNILFWKLAKAIFWCDVWNFKYGSLNYCFIHFFHFERFSWNRTPV